LSAPAVRVGFGFSGLIHSLPETAGSYPKTRDLLSDSISLRFMDAH
jgi:hypothetical protein